MKLLKTSLPNSKIPYNSFSISSGDSCPDCTIFKAKVRVINGQRFLS